MSVMSLTDIRPSDNISLSDLNEIILLRRQRSEVNDHDGMPLPCLRVSRSKDRQGPQGQGHGDSKFAKMADFKVHPEYTEQSIGNIKF